MTPLVSIAIPIYNAEKFLAFAIQSVINQSYTNWELTLIDDGSTDSSSDIAKKFAALDKRINYINDGLNKGLPTRLNETVLLAQGVYYARMDADDIMAINRIEKQVEFLISNPNIDVIGSSTMRITANNEIYGSINMEGITTGFVHPTVMGKKSWFVENPYNEKMRRSQDTELWLRTVNYSKFYNLPAPLLFYRDIGIPSANKYCSGEKDIRKLYKRYKLYGKSVSWFIKNTVISYIKQSIYYTFTILRCTDILVRMRTVHSVPPSRCLNYDDLKNSIKK